ncbi:(4Fe-4S)-binding protein [Alistipes onderdonkii]|uniref:(4Fe-4S)-binding protein n=1 Tax=Alistipes onderdonkii TaxID=328813 RepID=UPI0018754FFB|nr:(4Fe-4S)-binding protein [Alistipes onderdonkii]MBE5048625.1 (4Fe-4S)-binding protein [Alistipes onderdonkii]
MEQEKKRIEYTNGEIVVVWQPHLCIHAGVCVKMLPEVYRPSERPWVKLEYSTTDKIIAQVEKCPSGALSYRKA